MKKTLGEEFERFCKATGLSINNLMVRALWESATLVERGRCTAILRTRKNLPDSERDATIDVLEYIAKSIEGTDMTIGKEENER